MSDCCCECQVTQNIPGPTGASGVAGTNGVDGINAFTTTAADFVMPAEGADVTIEVVSSAWVAFWQYVFVGDLSSAAQGTFKVKDVTDATHVTLTNLADTATGAYPNNSIPTTTFPSGSRVAPAGQQGPAGVDGTSGAATTSHFVTTQTDAPLTSAFSLGTLTTGLLKHTVAAGVSTPATASDGTDYLSPTTGLSKAGNLAGLANPATSRTNLGLGTIATQAASAVSFSGGSITGTSISGAAGSFTTLAASGIFSLTPTALQTMDPAGNVTPNGKVRVVGNGAPVTLGNPNLTAGTVDGQICLIMGTNNTNTVTFQDVGSAPLSAMKLGAASRALGSGDTLLVSWDATLAAWCEVAFTNVV